MKNVFLNLIVLMLLLGSCTTFAQNLNNRRGLGGNTDLGTDGRYNAPEKRKPVDHVKIMTDNMTTKLNLDSFQSAIVKNIIEDFTATITGISMENIPSDAKAEKSNNAKAAMETKFKEILTDKQKVLFDDLLKESGGKEKDKKKKKRKNEAVAPEE